MTTDQITAIVPRDVAEAKALSKDFANSALMPQALRKKPEDIFAIVLAGAELGLAPMQAVRGMHIINGKIGLDAALLAGLVKRSSLCEYLQVVKSDGQVATYRTKRRGDPEPTEMSFTIAQAKAAGLTSNANWTKYPDAMLRARAVSAISRAVYPDLVFGVYETTEIEERDVTPQAEHVQTVREALRAEVTEAEIVTPLDERIRTAPDAAALTALLPEIGQLPEPVRAGLRPLFIARKAEVGG